MALDPEVQAIQDKKRFVQNVMNHVGHKRCLHLNRTAGHRETQRQLKEE